MKKIFLSMLLLTTITINASQPIKIKVPKEKLAECREIKEIVLVLLNDPVLAKRAYDRAYNATEEYKTHKKAYRSTKQGKACQKAYQSTETYKAYKKAYDATEERKAKRKADAAARYQQKKLLAKSLAPKSIVKSIESKKALN